MIVSLVGYALPAYAERMKRSDLQLHDVLCYIQSADDLVGHDAVVMSLEPHRTGDDIAGTPIKTERGSGVLVHIGDRLRVVKLSTLYTWAEGNMILMQRQIERDRARASKHSTTDDIYKNADSVFSLLHQLGMGHDFRVSRNAMGAEPGVYLIDKTGANLIKLLEELVAKRA